VYTRPLDLNRFSPNWMWSESGIAEVARRLYDRKSGHRISRQDASDLYLSDERSCKANTLGTNFDWVFGFRDNL
jgi:hypothetical protein